MVSYCVEFGQYTCTVVSCTLNRNTIFVYICVEDVMDVYNVIYFIAGKYFVNYFCDLSPTVIYEL